MRLALIKTYEAMPEPKIVIAVGASAISGGIFRGHPEVHDGADGIIPIDLYIPGDPPHPLTILDGLLRLLGRLQSRSRACPVSHHRAAVLRRKLGTDLFVGASSCDQNSYASH